MLNNASIEKILDLTADEIIVAVELQKVAKEAADVAQLIRDTYHCFGLNEDQIEVYRDHDGCNREFLTHDGVWLARYLHQSYNVDCSTTIIYEYLRAEFLVNNGYMPEYEGNILTDIGEKKLICSYFRKFVELTRKRKKELDEKGYFDLSEIHY